MTLNEVREAVKTALTGVRKPTEYPLGGAGQGDVSDYLFGVTIQGLVVEPPLQRGVESRRARLLVVYGTTINQANQEETLTAVYAEAETMLGLASEGAQPVRVESVAFEVQGEVMVTRLGLSVLYMGE